MPNQATDLRPAATTLNTIQVPTDADFQTDTVTIPIKLCNLPPFHSVANQVLVLSADPDIELKKIALVIESDPAFAAEILFLANSSLFGFPSRMHVLRHAIAILGLDRIKALSITVAMRAFLGNRGTLIHQCWRHSAACALIAEEISPIFNLSSDRGYTAGLMHDIGRLGLLKSYPRELTPVLSGEYQDTQEVLRAEREVLNVDHGKAGAWLVKNWAFPASFVEVCEHHHDPVRARDSEVLQLVKVACEIADATGFAAVKCQEHRGYTEIVSALTPKLGRKALPPEEELRANVEARLKAFDH